jgi:hypothetical protein
MIFTSRSCGRAGHLRFVQLQFPPLLGLRIANVLDELDHLDATRHTAFGQLQKGFMRGGAGFVRVLKHAECAARNGALVAAPLPPAVRLGTGRGGRLRRARPESAQHFADDVADQSFVNCAHKFSTMPYAFAL